MTEIGVCEKMRCGRYRLCFLTVAVVMGMAAPHVHATSVFGLGSFGDYAVLVEGGAHTVQLTSDSQITGNLGIGEIGATGTSLDFQGAGDTITGNLDFGGSCNANGSASSCTNTALNVTVNSGAITPNVAAVGQAIMDATDLYNTYAADAASPLNGTLSPNSSGTATTLNISGLGAGIFVYDISSGWDDSVGFNITGDGLGDQGVVFNITGANNPGFIGAIGLTGIAADDVIWNVLSTGNLNTETHPSPSHPFSFSGIILDPNGAVNVDNIPFNGRFFGQATTHDFQFVSGAVIVAGPSDPGTADPGDPGDGATPEPASWILTLLGAGVLAFARRRGASRANLAWQRSED